MEFKYQPGRVYLEDPNGRPIAEILFPNVDKKTVNITHTWVDESLRGQGIAAKLVEEVIAQLKKSGKKAILTCPYAKAYSTTWKGGIKALFSWSTKNSVAKDL
jgi:predicted GNAT family acetyltransferase